MDGRGDYSRIEQNEEEMEEMEIMGQEEEMKTTTTTTTRKMKWWRKAIDLCSDDVSAREHVLLSPWEKWKKYRRLPFKFMLQLVLLIAVFVHVLLIVSQSSIYSRETIQMFDNVYAPAGFKDGIYTVHDCISAVRSSLKKYETFGSVSVDNSLHVNTTSDQTTLVVTRYSLPYYNRTTNSYNFQYFDKKPTITQEYNITSKDLGPLDDPNAKDNFFMGLISMDITLVMYNLNYGPLGLAPFRWIVTLQFNFENNGGQVQFNVATEKHLMRAGTLPPLALFIWFNAGIFILAFWLFFLNFKAFLLNFAYYKQLKRKYRKVVLDDDEEDIPTWERVPWRTKLSIFNLWNLSTCVGSLLLMISGIQGILFEYALADELSYYIVQGLGAAIISANMIRYLEYGWRFFVLIGTVKNAFFFAIRHMISVAPAFIGFALFGVIVFSEYTPDFISFQMTAISQFHLMLGDNILPTFRSLDSTFPITAISDLYVVLYLIFFIVCVLNVFIFIIQSGFNKAHKVRRLRRKDDEDAAEEIETKDLDLASLFTVMEQRYLRSKRQLPTIGLPTPSPSPPAPPSRTRFETSVLSDSFDTLSYRGDRDVPAQSSLLSVSSTSSSLSASSSSTTEVSSVATPITPSSRRRVSTLGGQGSEERSSSELKKRLVSVIAQERKRFEAQVTSAQQLYAENLIHRISEIRS